MDPIPDPLDELLAHDAHIRELAAALARDDSSAEDIAQESWLRALGARGGLRAVRPWLSALVRNAASNLRRAGVRHRARERCAAHPEADASPGPFDLAVFEERRRLLVRAVESLPAGQRRVVVARYWEGLEPAAIARRDGEDPAAVRQRLRRALAALRARLDRAGRGDARAWLLPLAASARGGRSAAGPVLVLGGLAMNKTLTALAGLLLVLLATAVAVLAPVAVPRAPAGEDGNAPRAVATARAEGDVPARRIEVSTPARATPRGASVLVQADGTPAAGVPYWADERPYRLHPGRAPPTAPRTDGEGRFDLDSDRIGTGDFVWFEIDEGLSLAVAKSELGAATAVPVPALAEVTVEMRGLHSGDGPWRMLVMPAWSDDPGDVTHGTYHLRQISPPRGPTVWVARRVRVARAETGAARAVFRLVAGWPATFYCQALGHRIEPEIQTVTVQGEDLVEAHAGRRTPVLALEVVEADGVTPSSIGGQAILTPADPDDWTHAQELSGGRAALGWMQMENADLRWLTLLLGDGELIRFPAEEAWHSPGTTTLSAVRGTGRPAALRVACDPELLGWPDPATFVRIDGAWRKAGSPARIAEEPSRVAAWVHDRALVVQTWEPEARTDRVAFVARDGRIAMSTGGRLAALPSRAPRRVDLRGLIERVALPAGADMLRLRHDIALPGTTGDDAWLTLRILRLHRVGALGWRLSRTGSIDRHEPLPDVLPVHTPRGSRSRLLVRVSGQAGWVELSR